jgi:hypothetical protein
MQLRYSINADPNHKFTKEEIQNIKKEHLDHYTLTNRLKNSGVLRNAYNDPEHYYDYSKGSYDPDTEH